MFLLSAVLDQICKADDIYESESRDDCLNLYEICESDENCCSQYCWKPFLNVISNIGFCTILDSALNDTHDDTIIKGSFNFLTYYT